MEALNYLLNFLFDAYLMVLILRIWLQRVRADFYNPFSQFVVKATNPVVVPARRIIPSLGSIDLPTLLVAYLIATLKFIIIPLINGSGIEPAAVLIIGLLSLVKQFGVLLFMIMLIMALMSWIVQGYNPTQMLFQQLCEPFLRPIRKIMPDLGGIDLSVLVAFLLLNVINIFIAGIIPVWRVL
jgi:YggT family protein